MTPAQAPNHPPASTIPPPSADSTLAQSLVTLVTAIAENLGPVNEIYLSPFASYIIKEAVCPLQSAMASSTRQSAFHNFISKFSRLKRLSPVLDSAGTHHFPPNQSFFTSISPSNLAITLANNSKTFASGRGNAVLRCTRIPIRLKDAILSTSMPTPLISASRIVRNLAIIISKTKIYIVPQALVSAPVDPIATGTTNNGVFEFDNNQISASAASARFTYKAKRDSLHRTFNHHTDTIIFRLLNLWPALPLKIQSKLKDSTSCDPCHESKFSTAPHKTTLSESVKIMDKISTDTAGPLPASRSGHRYFTVLVDKCSKYYESIVTKTISSAELGAAIIAIIK